MSIDRYYYEIQLEDFQDSPFAKMVPRGLIETCQSDVFPFHLYGAWVGTRPAGLALTLYHPDENIVRLVWLIVVEPFRNKGLGRGLLEYCAEQAKQMGASSIVYEEEHKLPHDVKDWTRQFFSACGWPPFELQRKTSIFPVGQIEALPKSQAAIQWGLRKIERSKEYTVFPWSQLTDEDREYILRRKEEGWYTPIFNPFRAERHIEPLISYGIRYQGKVVGWFIGHRPSIDTVTYTSGFIDPAHRSSRILPAVFGLCLHRHSQHPEIARGIIPVEGDNETMLAFLKRVADPIAETVSVRYVTRKEL